MDFMLCLYYMRPFINMGSVGGYWRIFWGAAKSSRIGEARTLTRLRADKFRWDINGEVL